MFLSTNIHTSTYIFRLLANSDEMGILQKLVLIAPAWLEASKILLLTGAEENSLNEIELFLIGKGCDA